MKTIFTILFLISGCAVSPFYRTADISQELTKNGRQLEMLSNDVEVDFLDKQAFFLHYLAINQNKESFILHDLTWRISDLESKRNSILAKSSSIKEMNDKLLKDLEGKEEVRAADPEFEKIQTFAKTAGNQAKILFSEYANYKTASQSFAKFALFTGNIWKKSSSLK